MPYPCKCVFRSLLLFSLLSACTAFALVPADGAVALIAPSATPAASATVHPDTAGDLQSQKNPSQEQPAQEAPSSSKDAAGKSKSSETGIQSDGTDDFLLIRTLGGLGLVISVILLGFVGIRRFGPKYLRRRSDQQSLSIIESLQLGEKRSVALIKVCDQRLLIGHTANQITLLAQLPVAQDPVPANEQKIEARAPSAVATFRRLYEVEKNRPSQPESRQIPPDLRAKMRQLREALEK